MHHIVLGERKNSIKTSANVYGQLHCIIISITKFKNLKSEIKKSKFEEQENLWKFMSYFSQTFQHFHNSMVAKKESFPELSRNKL